MPDSSTFTVSDVRACVGSRRIVDVMECKTQRALEMSMRDFEHYFLGSDRKYIYNVLSLEFSHTKLAPLVQRPKVVDSMDWINLSWPQHLVNTQVDQTNRMQDMRYPKVQKYCLLSVASCYTDFHIDFGGTSVWYHIIKGQKTFWLIPPTEVNTELFGRWVLSGNQGDMFFGDMVDACQRVTISQGHSLLIPSGWIHAVYTPQDSLVFGGNFLHSFNIPIQLRTTRLENKLKIPNRFRFPFYTELAWFTLDRYLHCLTGKTFLSEEFQEKNMLHMNKISVNGDVKIHLTSFEREGLVELVEYLSDFVDHNNGCPESIENPADVLAAMKTLLEDHADDDDELAATGKPKAVWPVKLNVNGTAPKPVYKPRVPTPKPKKVPTTGGSGPTGRVRRIRCKQCSACLRSDCMECTYCKDMKKYGGPGTMKQTCILRKCLNPVMPGIPHDPLPPPPASPAAVVKPESPGVAVTPVKVEKPGKKRGNSVEVETELPPEKVPKLSDDDEEEQLPLPRVSAPRVVVSRVSIHDLARYAVRPAPFPLNGKGGLKTNGDTSTESDDDKDPVLKKTVWSNVFRYLSQKDLAQCLCVCRDFLMWGGVPKYWKNIDLTDKRLDSATQHCIVRRAPVSLNLSQTNVSYLQLKWIAERSPNLRKLTLIRSSWSAVGALTSASVPHLTSLDVSWSSGINDKHIKYLLSVPMDPKPGQEVRESRLRFLSELSLAGTEITDASIKMLKPVLLHLSEIDVSFTEVTNDGIQVLVVMNSKHQLQSITAQHCQKLTKDVLALFNDTATLKRLDLEGCNAISEQDCQELVERNDSLRLIEPYRFASSVS